MHVKEVRLLLDALKLILHEQWAVSRCVGFSEVCTFLSPSHKHNLENVFRFFIAISVSGRRFERLPPESEIDIDHPDFAQLKRIFLILVILILYIRFSIVPPLMMAYIFVLRFRHLSNTGFHLLHQIGLGPCVRGIPAALNGARQLFTPSECEHRVLWCDNVRRESAGRLRSSFVFDHTAIGYIRLDQPLPTIHQMRVRVNTMFEIAQELLCGRIATCDLEFGPCHFAESLIDCEILTVPLRAPGSKKYKFIGHSLQDYAIGTVPGTLRFLKELHDQPR